MSLSPVQSLRQPYGNPTGTLRNCSRLHVFISGCVYTMVTCNIWMMHVCFQGPLQLHVLHIWDSACCYAADTFIGCVAPARDPTEVSYAGQLKRNHCNKPLPRHKSLHCFSSATQWERCTSSRADTKPTKQEAASVAKPNQQ